MATKSDTVPLVTTKSDISTPYTGSENVDTTVNPVLVGLLDPLRESDIVGAVISCVPAI
jgi:hypothetical protein